MVEENAILNRSSAEETSWPDMLPFGGPHQKVTLAGMRLPSESYITPYSTYVHSAEAIAPSGCLFCLFGLSLISYRVLT
jgi:hypothetical protein